MTANKAELAPELEAEGLDEASLVEPGRTSAFAALAYRDFRLFWFGLVVSNVGTWMQLYGMGWLVVQLAIRDGVPQLAPFYLGLVGLSRSIPGLAFGLVAGVVADRADRRRLLMVTQASAATVAGTFAVLVLIDRINIVEVMLLVAMSSVIFSFDAPTRQAMVPRLVSDRELMSAIGLNSAAFNGATLVGPLVGGLVLVPVNLATGSTTIGVGALMALNCVTYLVIIGALILMKPQPVEDFGRPRQKMTESMQEGIRYVRRDPVLRWVIILAIATALLARPYIQLLPAVAQALHVGAVELSYLLAAAGVGALGGALSSASLGHVRRRGLVLIGASFAMGILLMVFALQRTLIGTIVTVALTSFAAMLFLTIANTLMQSRAPDHLRGRVMSVQTMVFMGLMPLGQLLLGSIGTVTEIGTAFLAGGVIVTAVTVYVGLTQPALRDAVTTIRPRAVARSG